MNKKQFVICIENQDYPASLEIRKIYETALDEKAANLNLFRVIDESEEDYLYPKHYFMTIELPEEVEKALHLSA
jgi:hypothetical protein